ncbi:Hypothetical predicted protein [Pelobates cultripes]|uniref:Uncharacterized protein n=1 Tax=Pelobates cultripes TaxID=61616 RepID=A0AAD1TNQ4_PELCU|nr:Hypothetical predicted protein [Pelobates cultripes]
MEKNKMAAESITRWRVEAALPEQRLCTFLEVGVDLNTTCWQQSDDRQRNLSVPPDHRVTPEGDSSPLKLKQFGSLTGALSTQSEVSPSTSRTGSVGTLSGH